MPKCTHSHEPNNLNFGLSSSNSEEWYKVPEGEGEKPEVQVNRTTLKALKESREEEGEIFESLEDFWEAMGMTPDA